LPPFDDAVYVLMAISPGPVSSLCAVSVPPSYFVTDQTGLLIWSSPAVPLFFVRFICAPRRCLPRVLFWTGREPSPPCNPISALRFTPVNPPRLAPRIPLTKVYAEPCPNPRFPLFPFVVPTSLLAIQFPDRPLPAQPRRRWLCDSRSLFSFDRHLHPDVSTSLVPVAFVKNQRCDSTRPDALRAGRGGADSTPLLVYVSIAVLK